MALYLGSTSITKAYLGATEITKAYLGSTEVLSASSFITGATVAYSLRKLSNAVSNVVRVRRSSDNAEQDFTANQIESGEMVNWVNTDVLTYESDFSSGTDGFVTTASPSLDGNIDSIGGRNDNLRLTSNAPLVTVNTYFRRNSILSVGNSYRVTFDAYIPSTNSVLDDFDTVAFGTSQVNVAGQITLDQWTSYDVTGTANNTALFIRLKGNSSGDATGDVVYIRNVQITQTTADGFVETWYDQSGNGNDATQSVATAQPKIVDGGSLVADGIDFDGVNDRLFGSHILNTDDVLYAAVVAKNKDFNGRGLYVSHLFYNAFNDNGGFAIEANTFNRTGSIAGWLDDRGVNDAVQDGLSSLTQNEMHLLSFDLSNGSSKFHLDGSLVNTFSTSMNSEDGGAALNIGNNASGVSPLDGSIKEIIIYNSDQSANSAAIEDNINAHYNIYP